MEKDEIDDIMQLVKFFGQIEISEEEELDDMEEEELDDVEEEEEDGIGR